MLQSSFYYPRLYSKAISQGRCLFRFIVEHKPRITPSLKLIAMLFRLSLAVMCVENTG